MRSPTSVLIVGAGPTGLSLACDLLNLGIPIRLIDSAAVPSNLSKAVVLMPRTLEAFELRGFVDRALEAGERIHSFSAYSKGRMVFHTEYNRTSSHYNYLINLPQAETEAILREQLTKAGGVIEWNTTLLKLENGETSARATIRHADGREEELELDYLVGCDGAHSTVRHAIGFEFEGDGYRDTWLLGDVTLDWKYRHGHGYSFFGDDGLLAIFPMKNRMHRLYIVQPLARELGRQPALDDLREAVERIAPGLCKITGGGWMSEFRCHHRKVAHYQKQRVLLAGDAAHIHSPETGLGMNTGIQDSYNLAWKLAAVLKNECVPSLLETYDSERSYVGAQVLKLSDFTHRMSSIFGPMGNLIRDPLWKFFSRYYSHHYENVELGLQTRIQYPENPFIEHHGGQEDLRDELYIQTAGRRLINGDLLTVSGETTTLYQELPALTSYLLIFAGHSNERETLQRTLQSVEVLPVKPVLVLPSQDTQGYEWVKTSVYLDPELRLHFTFGAQNGAAYLIRPDGYIGFSSQPIKPAALEKYLGKLFTHPA